MKKIGILTLVLIFALGSLGVGYAHWSQTLFIEGTVNTGSFCVGFSHQYSDDPVEEPCNPGAIDDSDRFDPGYTKNVAGCDCDLVDPKLCCEPDKEAWERMLITVCNAYPSYTNTIHFSLDNCGTIPAEVVGATIVMVDTTPVSIALPKCTVVPVDLDDDTYPDVNMHFDGPADQQIDPCESLWYGLTLHFKDGVDAAGDPVGLKQNTTYKFYIEIETIQWNH